MRSDVRLTPNFDVARLVEAVLGSPRSELRFQLRRPDDLLVADLLFRDFVLPTNGSAHLERSEPGASPLLIVEFPPQSFAEQAYLEMGTADNSAANDLDKSRDVAGSLPKKNVPPVRSEDEPVPGSTKVRMAGKSRVAFAMPAEVVSLPFTAASVLQAMRTWPMHLAPAALPDPDPDPHRWLELAVNSAPWAAASASLTDVLERGVAPGSAEAIADAAQRITERAAGALMPSTRDHLGKVTLDAMQREIDDLHAQFPSLKHGAAHRAGIAALAIRTTERMAAAGFLGDETSISAFNDVPYLWLLLGPSAPALTHTALELPYRLVLSPIENARWSHRDDVFAHQGRTELWHTRLTTATGDRGPDLESKVRAIWSPDYPLDVATLFGADGQPRPFRTSLDPADRKMLVRNMAGYDELQANGQVYTPRSSRARRLHLSSLGALLDVEGTWNTRPGTVDLVQWRHLAAVGRDAYVRVVYAGFLCCFGHAASLVKVTERKFEGARGARVAVLRQRFFLIVRERVKEYDPSQHRFEGRNFPFTRVEILTKVTPNLADPAASPLAGFNVPVLPRMVFWPMVEDTSVQHDVKVDFQFDIVATDIAGQKVTFSMPLLFVSEVPNAASTIDAIKTAYDAAPEQRRQGEFGNTTICFAKFEPTDNGDPRLPTARMTFGAGDRSGARHTDQPNFYPETRGATVGIRAVQKLLARPNAVIDVVYPDVYKQHGFGEADPTKNAGKLFLNVVGTPHRLEFGGDAGKAKSDALGALAAPQMSILGLSKIMGPVAAAEPANLDDAAQVEAKLQNVVSDSFHPADFFKGATILGGVELATILDNVTGLGDKAVPKLLSREFPDRVESSFDWTTEIAKPAPLNLLIPRADGSSPTKLTMHSLITAPLGNPAAATFEATATVTNFKLNLFGMVILWFDELTFTSRKGQKPHVAVHLDDKNAVRFGGALEFVNELRELIPSGGFSGGSLAVTPSGISAGYSLNIPTVGVGIFVLSNASIGASFNLPFDAQPASVRFNFSTREHPFNLTVSAIGGGGFFAIGISSRGVQEIEAALEFGACVAINLGVASGLVEIKAGIYFHWREASGPTPAMVELSGYVRLHGELSVIGLISVSLTFNLQLSYAKVGEASTVWGEATLAVEVEVLFFSASVSVHCRREFGGSKSDPKFVELIPNKKTWAEYCDAFAPEAA